MNTILSSTAVMNSAAMMPVPQPALNGKDDAETRQAFDQFVGETFFGQMIKAMRKSVGKPAYVHGGRAEEIFQEQLDQTMAQQISHASADQFTGPMFELFTMQRR
jgi:peptidoglycan hydrolase FlgJ